MIAKLSFNLAVVIAGQKPKYAIFDTGKQKVSVLCVTYPTFMYHLWTLCVNLSKINIQSQHVRK